MIRSLKGMLVVGTVAGTVAVVIALSLAVFLLVRADLRRQFDASMYANARLLSSAVLQDRGKLKREFDELDMGDFQPGPDCAYLQLWTEEGRNLYRSPSLGQNDLLGSDYSNDVPHYRQVELPDGRTGRSIGLSFVPRREEHEEDNNEDEREEHHESSGARNEGNRVEARIDRPVILVLARDTDAMTRTLWHLASILMLSGLVSAAALAGALWLIIRNALRPLDDLAGQIADLGEHDLSLRIDLRRAPGELRPVVARLNDLLAQLQEAFHRERAFSQNVAHELRTPLAGLGMKLDVSMARPRKLEEYEAAMSDCRSIVRDMTRMVQNLLSLARLECGAVALHPRELDLNDLVTRCWEPLEPAAYSRGLRVHWDMAPAVPLVSDESQLELAVRNALENAVQYADEGGTVQISTDRTEVAAEVSIRNSGSLISAEDAKRVFDRFWRGDLARSDASTHCGLGLALAENCIRRLNGKIHAQSTVGEEFQLLVSVPDLGIHHKTETDKDPKGQ